MARDLFHPHVREALEKEGWTITADPLRIELEETHVDVDLAAEKVFAAEKAGEKIAVEVKSFLGRSFMADFHEAIGQYADYRSALEDSEPERLVYLALPTRVIEHKVFRGRFIQKRLREENARLLFYNPLEKTIEKWIKEIATAKF